MDMWPLKKRKKEKIKKEKKKHFPAKKIHIIHKVSLNYDKAAV